MPLVNEEVKFKAQGNDAFSQNQNFTNQSNFNPNSTQANEPQKGLLTLPPALMQIIPWIPFALEAISGQKVPQIGGTIGEIQSSLQQIQFSLTQLLNSQQQLYTKLASLESSASHQLTSLKEQVINTSNSFKLLATETKRSLEFSQKPQLAEA